jgi:hypothetical protein
VTTNIQGPVDAASIAVHPGLGLDAIISWHAIYCSEFHLEVKVPTCLNVYKISPPMVQLVGP